MVRSNTNTPGESRRTDNNLLRFHGDAASSAIEDAAGNYQSPSIIAAGADAPSVSVLVMLINFSLALLCIKAPALIEKAGMTRKGAIILSFLNVIVWVPLIIAFLLSRLGIAPAWFAIFWFVNLMPALLLSVQRDNWLSNLVPRSSLGRYLGQRLAIKSAFYLGSFILLGFLLDAFGDSGIAGFAFIFILAMGASLIDFVIFTFMTDSRSSDLTVPEPAPPPKQFGMHEYIGELKEKKLGTFVTFTSLFYFSVGLCGPLYAIYMLQELHLSYLGFTTVISAEYVARIASVPFWGRWADRVGNIRVLGIVSRVIPFIPVLWLFSGSLPYLGFVQVLSGICWGAYDLCTQSYLFRVAPRERKLRYIVYTRSLVLLSMAVGGLLGAFFVNGIFLTFGSRILSVFLVSAVFRAGTVLYLMPRLVDLAMSYSGPSRRPAVSLDNARGAPTSKRGLYYWRRERDEATGEPRPTGRRENVIEAPAVNTLSATRRRGWYHDSEMQQTHAPARLARVMPEKRPPERASLYHDPDGWSSYMKETLNAIVREGREFKAAITPKKACAVRDYHVPRGMVRNDRDRGRAEF